MPVKNRASLLYRQKRFFFELNLARKVEFLVMSRIRTALFKNGRAQLGTERTSFALALIDFYNVDEEC
jgi:hypothetical protein